MSIVSGLTSAFQRVRDEFNTVKGLIGSLATLNTTDKSSLVNAINEVIGSAGVQINDLTGSATTTYSGNKIDSDIATAQANAIATAQTNTNTAIAIALEGEDLSDLADSVTALAQADNGLVSTASAQTFDATQKAQARTNIDAQNSADIGDTNHNFTADFTTGLN